MGSPSTSDALVALLLLALLVLVAAGRAVEVVELVLDERPSAQVTVNGYPPVWEGYCGEGYCMVFVVPRAASYTVHPACCSRAAGLREGVNRAYWLGGCVAVRTD